MSEHSVVATLLSRLGVTPDSAKKAAEILSEDDMTKANPDTTKKAMPHATMLTPGQMVESLWEEGQLHRVPGADTLKVGPVQESSGAGAEKMIREYSNPAPQMGIQVQAEELAAHLHAFHGAMKSIAGKHDALVDVVTKSSEQIQNLTTVAAAILAKAEEHEKEEEKKREEEHDEHHMDKAATYFKKARQLLKKSKAIKVEAKAVTVKADAKNLKRVATLLRKAAARYLMRARTEALAGRGTAVDRTFESRKAIDAFLLKYPALKADMEEMQHEKKEKDEAKKARQLYKAVKANLKAAAAKAVEGHADADGNQADKQDPSNGNQDDSAVKAATAAVADVAAKVDNALNGLGLLKTDVKGLMDTIAGRSITPPVGDVVPLLKGGATQASTIDKISEQLDAAEENGSLDLAHLIKAQSLLTRLDGVQKGAIAKGVFDAELASAPAKVREFFQAA